ncbi:transglycosylase SLT domain-containing protein [Saccharomonospora glauca]|uniref:Transglycosylase family protein n=1 Tax=Saccharomonospora glauca K62 TaxID=928724 RepID=I1D5L4_9PSEU|nr:transglycosylase SLT domain-containing protein [Saccharomonospora glauca]EIF00239.1 transglycosylase family protein [Saccharomonospora glauca K62]
MADHKMFERVKKLIALQAPTRNISAPATSLGRSVRAAARGYASVGVLALFVTGVASPAVMAGTDEEATRTVAADTAAVAQQYNAESAKNVVGGGKAENKKDDSAPVGGGAPAPRSADPNVAQEAPAEAEQQDAAAEEQPEQPAEPAAEDQGGGGAQPAAQTEPVDELDGWIRTAISVMQEHGEPVSEADIPSIRTVIEKESSGDPKAINLWDINAKRGTPSKGLMQTIDSTFNAYKLPGYEDIYDPVSNIIAGTRYTLSRYGSFAEHPGLAQMAAGGGYRGY